MPRCKNNHYTENCIMETFANRNAYGVIDVKQAPEKASNSPKHSKEINIPKAPKKISPKIKIGSPTPPDSPILEQAKKDSNSI